MMNQTDSQSDSITEEKPLSLDQQQQHEMENAVDSHASSSGDVSKGPNLPNMDLLRDGCRKEYLEIGISLYKASVKGDWEAAKAILNKKPELVRCSITENGETALHVAASTKSTKEVEHFVKNLVNLMEKEDLELENQNYNTAPYLAAARGNIKTVKFMSEKNPTLHAIPGGGSNESKPQMMPVYVAALFGNYVIVKYLYEKSKDLSDDDGWTTLRRGWLLDKCAEADMFGYRKDYLELGVPLYKASVKGDWKAAKAIFDKNPELNLVRWCITENGETALHVAASTKSSKEVENFVKNLVDFMETEDLELENQNYNTALYLAAARGNIKTVKTMMEKNPTLHAIPGGGSCQSKPQMMPLYVAALFGNYEVVKYLYEKSKDLCHDYGWTSQNRSWLLEKCVEGDMFDIALKIVEKYPTLGSDRGGILALLAQKPEAFREEKTNIIQRTIKLVKHRHEGIYNLLYEIGSMKDLITPLRDEDGANTMLHLAAKSTTIKRLEDVSGAALQMQRQLLWFKEVRSIMPPSYRLRKNNKGLTPRELFTMEHQDLMIQAEKWMKSTASQCMVVATLIATIVFAAAFTVPGGYDQNNGIPMFNRKVTFVVFVVADAVSLVLSSTSILTFLSILTSRYAERDFLRKLPTKLMLGLSTLFFSITTMMITFSVSFFVLYHNEMKWIPISIGVIAIMPVVLYVVLQYHLLIDVICAAYAGMYLFKPMNEVILYENPKI